MLLYYGFLLNEAILFYLCILFNIFHVLTISALHGAHDLTFNGAVNMMTGINVCYPTYHYNVI